MTRTSIQQLQSMTPKQVVDLAKRIVKQCLDRETIANKLGDDEEFFQIVCDLLIEFKMGARELLADFSLEEAVCGLTRGEARRNWMSDRATTHQREGDGEGEEAFYEEDAGDAHDDHSLDDVPGLTALDKLLIKHSARSNTRQSSTTKDIAGFFGITTRAVRMRKEKLHAELRERFNLPANFFEEKAEPPMPHLKKEVKVEKDPLANFVPMPSNFNNFNAFRRVGIR